MSYQGLFTQGTTVDELLAKRSKRQQDMQQQLMNQAAQGARDPQRARMGSMFGSILGRALGNNAGGADTQMQEAEQRESTEAGLVKQYATAASGTDVAEMYASANAMIQYGDPRAIQMGSSLLQRADQLKSQRAAANKEDTEKRQDQLALRVENEAKATADSDANQELQKRATALGQGLEEYDPVMYAALTSGDANAQTITQGYTSQRVKLKQQYDEAKGTTKQSSTSFTEAGSFADLNGNMYVTTKAVKADGSSEIIYTGIGNAPVYKDGTKLVPLNSNNMSVEDQIKLKGEGAAAQQQAKDWSDTMSTARENRISLQDSEYFIDKAIRLLPVIGKTGSVITKLTKEATDFWGVTSADIGEFDQLSAKTALGQLKTTFGASPTEGERAILFSIQANINNNKGLNTRILKSAKEMVMWRIRANKAALSDSSASGKKYNEWLLNDDNGPPRYVPEEVETIVAPALNVTQEKFEWNANATGREE